MAYDVKGSEKVKIILIILLILYFMLHVHMSNRICCICIPLYSSSMMMAM